MSETEKAPTSTSDSPPPIVVTEVVEPASLTNESANSTPADGLPEWEPLTPELVEDEAIRGDFMLSWAVVLLALLIGCRQIVETTTLVHVKTGRYLASHGFLPPTNDVFSATAGEHRWVNLSWLWDLISSGLFAIGEGIGLSLATALLVAATWSLLGKTSRPGVSSWFGSILGVLTLLACHPQFSGQPETVTLFGVAATFWWLHVWRSSSDTTASMNVLAMPGRPMSLWWMVPGFVLWSNLDHRMFLGLTLLLLWGLGEIIGHVSGRTSLTATQRAHFWKVVGTCVVASTLNPSGGQALFSPVALYGTEYPAWHLYVPAISGSEEAGAFSLLTSDLWRSGSGRLPLVAGVVVLASALVSIVLNARRVNFGDVLTFAGFVALAAVASHELAAASVLACAIGTLNAQQWYQSSFRQSYSIEPKELLFTRGGRAITVLAFFALAVVSVNQSLFGAEGKRVGVGLSNRLRAMIAAYRDATTDSFDNRPFNFMPSQGDVLLWLDQKPFVDSRLALFARRGEPDLLTLHDQARQSLTQLTDQKAASDQLPSNADSDERLNAWRPIFDRFQLTHVLPRLFGGNPTAYFRLLAKPEWKLAHLGSHCAVFYRQKDASPELTQFLDKHEFSLRKLAFQTTEPASLRTDWPRIRSSLQKTFGAPEPLVSNKALEAETLLLHLRAILNGQLVIDEASAIGIAHLAIRKANAGLAESADNATAYQILGEAYSFLLNMEIAIEQANGVPFENRLRFYQALAAYHQAILLNPKSLFLRDRLVDLLQRHNRLDLVLRELDVIDKLTPLTDSENPEESEALQRRLALREHCESRHAALQERVTAILEQGQNAAELASQVYEAGFVLEAMRLLNLDQDAVRESPDLQILQSLLRLESGEIEEVHGQFEYFSENNQASWRIPAAWTRLAHGEYERAIELWMIQSAITQQSSVTGVLATLPIIQSRFHLLGHPNVWPTHHTLLLQNAQTVSESEMSSLNWYIAMCQIESGSPLLAGKTLTGLLEANPETPFRPLIRFYLFAINDELIDREPPSDWIPIDGEMFTPDDPANAETK
ncbi:MAG: hypothetical protein FJ302_00670 [Planctomycetes bacterium]|nr:hypothetical protein [Planctomycetota bacterium]